MTTTEETMSRLGLQQVMDWITQASEKTAECAGKALRFARTGDFRDAATSALQARNAAQTMQHYLLKQMGGDLDQTPHVESLSEAEVKTLRLRAELSAIMSMTDDDFNSYMGSMESGRAEHMNMTRQTLLRIVEDLVRYDLEKEAEPKSG